MKNKFTFFQDSGHGWVKVPISLLRHVGISGKITPYSYQKGVFAYLEEDCDLSLFIGVYREKFGVEPILENKYTNKQSKIRSYTPYDSYYENNRGVTFSFA